MTATAPLATCCSSCKQTQLRPVGVRVHRPREQMATEEPSAMVGYTKMYLSEPVQLTSLVPFLKDTPGVSWVEYWEKPPTAGKAHYSDGELRLLFKSPDDSRHRQ